MSILINLATSLVLTIIIELTSSFFLGIKSDKDIRTIILVNICTNPIVVLIANILIISNVSVVLYHLIVTVMEGLVVMVEASLYKKHLKDYKSSPFKLSLINNIISYLSGFLFNYLLNYLI